MPRQTLTEKTFLERIGGQGLALGGAVPFTAAGVTTVEFSATGGISTRTYSAPDAGKVRLVLGASLTVTAGGPFDMNILLSGRGIASQATVLDGTHLVASGPFLQTSNDNLQGTLSAAAGAGTMTFRAQVIELDENLIYRYPL